MNSEVFPLSSPRHSNLLDGIFYSHQVYGVSIHAFVNWYVSNYNRFLEPGCIALRTYLHERIPGFLDTEAWDAILQEFFPQKEGKRKVTLRGWLGVKGRDDNKIQAARQKYMQKLLAREDRVLVCFVYIRYSRKGEIG